MMLSIMTCHVLGAENTPYTPEKLLPAGVDETVSVNPYTGESGKARKGTVAATINNIALLNKILLANPVQSDNKNTADVVKSVEALLPSLKVIGLFDFFNPREWLSNPVEQPGRTLVAVLYLQKYPETLDKESQAQLDKITKETNITLLKTEIGKIRGMKP